MNKYIIRNANPSGGKAGKGKNKTSTIQVLLDSCVVKQFRYNVREADDLHPRSEFSAMSKAIVWVTEKERRRKT